jgi:hypothetical protein
MTDGTPRRSGPLAGLAGFVAGAALSCGLASCAAAYGTGRFDPTSPCPLAPCALTIDASPASTERPARKPDGVVLEPPPALPPTADRSEAAGVVALREPLGEVAVRTVVRALVDAWLRESLEQLVALLTSDAGPLEARARGRASLVEGFRQRLHAHEYRRLAGADVVHPERIERYGWNDLVAPNAVPRPTDMRPEELFVRVPLEVTRTGGERLFGDVLLLLLRREGDRYLVAAYGELGL